jgi:DNA-binding transcriptional ArsR family regulator
MSTKTDETDQAWRALGDPTRRAILDLLAAGPATTGDIESRFPISRIAVMKHLRLLADAGLVTARKSGRQRWHYLNGQALDNLAARWLTPLSRRWAFHLRRLQKFPEGLPEPMSAKPDIDIAHDVSIAAPPATVFKALTDDIGAWVGASWGM